MQVQILPWLQMNFVVFQELQHIFQLQRIMKTTSLSLLLHPSLNVTAMLPFLTLTGVFGMDLTILRAGSLVTLLTAKSRSERTTPAKIEIHSLSPYFRLSSVNLSNIPE